MLSSDIVGRLRVHFRDRVTEAELKKHLQSLHNARRHGLLTYTQARDLIDERIAGPSACQDASMVA